jgi:hypothetical protein
MSEQIFLTLGVLLAGLGAAESWRGAVFAVVLAGVVFQLGAA